MSLVLGYRVFDRGVPLFVQRPDHASYAVQQVIERTDPKSVMRKEGQIVVIPVTEHIKCAPWVVIYDIPGRSVWTTRWTPEAPRQLEVDHEGKRRFNVAAFHETKEAADRAVEMWAEKHNYNQYRS